MFYGNYVLSKKGPLAKIWLAAHWEKKLTKAAVFDTNIEATVNNILEPKVRMALRTVGHLMLGIVRIYSRKTKYLLADCNEAFLKIKLAFRPGQVDLPEEAREANPHAINLPDVFTDFDSALPDFADIDTDSRHNQVSRKEDITISDDVPMLANLGDDDLGGDIGFDSIDLLRHDSTIVSGGRNRSSAADVTIRQEKDTTLLDVGAPADDFGGQLDENLLNDLDMDNLFGEQEEGVDQLDMEQDGDQDAEHRQPPVPEMHLEQGVETELQEEEDSQHGIDAFHATLVPEPQKGPEETHTTLIANEEDAFALEPLETAGVVPGYERQKARRKRKLIVDEVKAISAEEMRVQINSPGDTLTTLLIAPPTKRLMFWHETNVTDKLFTMPPSHVAAKKLQTFYSGFLVTRSAPDDNEVAMSNEEKLQLGTVDEAAAAASHVQSVTPAPSELEQALGGGALLGTIPEESGEMSAAADIPLAGGPPPASVQQDDFRAPPSVSPEPFSPWALGHDEPPIPFTDLEAPPTQGLLMPEEQHVLEEEEEEEEPEGESNARWNKRQDAFLRTIKKHVRQSLDETASFKALTKNSTRKLAAQKFYTLLILKKWSQIEVQQEFAFDDIRITLPPTHA